MKSTAVFPMKSFPFKALALIFLIGFSPKLLFGQDSIELMQLSPENNIPLLNSPFDKSSDNLIQHLIHKIHLSETNPSCHNEIGIFIFKFNNKGKVSTNEIKFMGTLLDSTKDEIIANIKSLPRTLKPKNKTLIEKNHWYIFKYTTKVDHSKCNDKAAVEILNQIENNDKFYWAAIITINAKISDRKKNITMICYEQP
jgi:hypothetical protein